VGGSPRRSRESRRASVRLSASGAGASPFNSRRESIKASIGLRTHWALRTDGNGARYLMEPSPLAKLLQLAEIDASDSVLDVGCGTGYCAALLSRLAKSVIALESDAGLAETAKAELSAQGCDNVAVVTGPLPQGHAAKAPYNVILIGGSVEEVPAALLGQLAEGGRLVAVEGQGNAGVARLFFKAGGVVTGRRAFNAAIKPLPGFERVRAFEF